MLKKVDAEYAWLMEQLQEAVDELARLVERAEETMAPIRDRIDTIRRRIELLLQEQMDQPDG